ncbi:hypothetical protein NA8A_23964 [Nitratireductor indicus C115]|uniref:Uncharacterized protein n=1 Tax=Nitratireductor indicus C115 TaxID=1231190 RepID=K2NXK7_9HYPH|nr:hypothetical protein NA8A_23964 [Nitratireductor indicus C115]
MALMAKPKARSFSQSGSKNIPRSQGDNMAVPMNRVDGAMACDSTTTLNFAAMMEQKTPPR